MSATDVGPDLVIAGAARSGTSFLASLLGNHPQIDPCAVKEPNYFSREHARGPEWYDSLFRPRVPGLLRLDASMSYTFAHFPEALDRLAEEAPRAFLVYSVRHPVDRLVSHFHLHRDYFRNETARTLGEALDRTDVYRGASDYATWLPRLEKLFGRDRVLVVPFGVVTGRPGELLEVLEGVAGLDAHPLTEVSTGVTRHRNQVVEYRHRGVRLARRWVRRSGLYPTARRVLGPDRLRLLRTWTTRPVASESPTEALATCHDSQRQALADLHHRAGAAVADFLAEQDARLGLSWAAQWARECPMPGESGVDW